MLPYSVVDNGYPLTLMRIRIHLFTSTQIRIQGAKPMRIIADPDPGQTAVTNKLYMKMYMYGTKVIVIGHKTYLRRYKWLFERLEFGFLVNFGQLIAPSSESQHCYLI
jgi:hypothetical protein